MGRLAVRYVTRRALARAPISVFRAREAPERPDSPCEVLICAGAEGRCAARRLDGFFL